MRYQTIAGQLCDWIGHARSCDKWPQREECRLTFDQAMRLCFEISVGSNETETRKDRALAAYKAGRPWDFLSGSHMYAWLVPA